MIAANLLSVASTAGMAIASLHMATLRRQLRRDPLTGLANRAGLHRAFDRSRVRSGGCLGVLMVDLDNFKAINDTHGHRVGDQVLIEVGRRLQLPHRREELAVRLSGDEFAIWLGAFDDTTANRLRIDELAVDVAASIASPMRVSGAALSVSASVGVAITTGKPARLEDLLERADRAMYSAKGRTRRSRRSHIATPDVRQRQGSRNYSVHVLD